MKQHGETERYGDTSYVASVGTCKGDSGGPAFVEEMPGHFVVTGSGNNFNQIYAGGQIVPHPHVLYECMYEYICVPIFGRVNNSSSFLGVVSGGRGVLGECGGINNPIHYVRFKRFTRWVIMNIQSKAR